MSSLNFFPAKIRTVRKLPTICSGENYTSVGTGLCARFNHVFTRLLSLEGHPFLSSSLGQNPLPPSLSSSQMEITALKAELVLTHSDLQSLIASMGETYYLIGGVRFESRGQTILGSFKSHFWCLRLFLQYRYTLRCAWLYPSVNSRFLAREISHFTWKIRQRYCCHDCFFVWTWNSNSFWKSWFHFSTQFFYPPASSVEKLREL